MKNYLYIIIAFIFLSCTKMNEDEGNTPVTGKWELASYELIVEPQSLYGDVMAVFYPDGLPAVQENTGYIFSGNFYRIFDEKGKTAQFFYRIQEDTLTFVNAPTGVTNIFREVIFKQTNNELRLGHSIFDEEVLASYREWIYLNSINWQENEESTERYNELAPLMEGTETIINLLDNGLEQVYLYAVYSKK